MFLLQNIKEQIIHEHNKILISISYEYMLQNGFNLCMYLRKSVYLSSYTMLGQLFQIIMYIAELVLYAKKVIRQK